MLGQVLKLPGVWRIKAAGRKLLLMVDRLSLNNQQPTTNDAAGFFF